MQLTIKVNLSLRNVSSKIRNRREYTLCMQLTIKVNLSLRNVSSKIRNRVRNIIVRHRKNRQLSNRSITSNHTTSSFVDSTQIGVHITRISTTTWYFFTCSRNLT